MTVIQRGPPASPCVGVCVIDEARGICTGCARTLDEIATWGGASDAFRDRTWADLPRRAAEMGLETRRLDWQGHRLLDEVAQRLADAAGTLVAGVYGAVAEVMRDQCKACDVKRHGSVLTLSTGRAALRLEAARYLTAFEIARSQGAPLLALAVPTGRALSPGRSR